MKNIKIINYSELKNNENTNKIIFCENDNLLKCNLKLSNIKLLNFKNIKHSNCYNPFNYFTNDLKVLDFSNFFIENFSKPTFTHSIQKTFLASLILYLTKYRPKEEQSFSSITKLSRAAHPDITGYSPLERIFSDIEKRDYDSLAYKLYSGSTMLKFDLLSCAEKIYSLTDIFDAKEIKNFTDTDELELSNIFISSNFTYIIILPDKNSKLNIIKKMFFNSLLTLFKNYNVTKYRKSLSNKLEIYLDNVSENEEDVEKLIGSFNENDIEIFKLNDDVDDKDFDYTKYFNNEIKPSLII